LQERVDELQRRIDTLESVRFDDLIVFFRESLNRETSAA
jgi:hypothetical protein